MYAIVLELVVTNTLYDFNSDGVMHALLSVKCYCCQRFTQFWASPSEEERRKHFGCSLTFWWISTFMKHFYTSISPQWGRFLYTWRTHTTPVDSPAAHGSDALVTNTSSLKVSIYYPPCIKKIVNMVHLPSIIDWHFQSTFAHTYIVNWFSSHLFPLRLRNYPCIIKCTGFRSVKELT